MKLKNNSRKSPASVKKAKKLKLKSESSSDKNLVSPSNIMAAPPSISSMSEKEKKSLKLRGLPLVRPSNLQEQKLLKKKKILLKKKANTTPSGSLVQGKKAKKLKKHKVVPKPEDSESEQEGEVKEEVETEPVQNGAAGKKAKRDGPNKISKRAEKAKKLQEKLLIHPVGKLMKKAIFPNEEKLRKNIVKAIAAVQISAKAVDGKKDILDDPADVKIFLRIGAFKYPRVQTNIRVKLPHPYLIRSEDERPAEICLMVKDTEKGPKIDHEESVQHYKDLLKSKDIDFITRVISVRELKNEYKHDRLRANLSRQYDVFLADKDIIPTAVFILGKHFVTSTKRLVPVDMKVPDLKAEITKVLSLGHLHWKPTSNQASMLVGMSYQPENHLVENVEAAIIKIREKVRGGWANIKTISLQNSVNNLAVPVYISMSSGNSVALKRIDKTANDDRIVDSLTTHPETQIAIDRRGKVDFWTKKGKGEPKKVTPLSEPMTRIPTAKKPENKPKKDDEMDIDEAENEGKLEDLESAYLKQKLAETEEKASEATEEKEKLETSSSLQGVRKRKKRNRKVNLGTPEGDAPPKSPTPDYSVSEVNEAETVEESKPSPPKKVKMSLEKKVANGPKSPDSVLRGGMPSKINSTPALEVLKKIGEYRGADSSLMKENLPKQKTSTPKLGPKPGSAQKPASVQKQQPEIKTPMSGGKRNKRKSKQFQVASAEKSAGKASAEGEQQAQQPIKKRPRSILKPAPATPNSPTRKSAQKAFARDSPSKSAGKAPGGRRVRFSLPQEGVAKKPRRKTMM